MHPTPEQVFATLADRPGAAWLDGGDHPEGWSVLAWDPAELVTRAEGWPDAGRGLQAPRAEIVGSSAAPFQGGVLGYVGYGAGWVVDAVPRCAPTPEPDVWLGRFTGGLCFRHQDRTWHPAGSPAFLRAAEEVLAVATELRPPSPAPALPARSVVRDDYEASVRRILAWLEAGDCYQVNLSRPVYVDGFGPAFEAYRRLRSRSSAAYGAYLHLASGLDVLSNSPELFLEVRGDRARSRPIKGTRPRGADPATDRALLEELAASAKDTAELTMIVDLVRNDLGRLARPGTVTTTSRAVTTHANVHHASQDVCARLVADRDAWDALAATFPPGSVTGAPKVRACQRIAEVEPDPRGVYCGAIGYVSVSGDATWSVAIRTAVAYGDRARYHVGGGVVIASDPGDEWEETVAKGRALAAALHGDATSARQ